MDARTIHFHISTQWMVDVEWIATLAPVQELPVSDRASASASASANEKTSTTEPDAAAAENFAAGRSWRFWVIFPSLMVTTLLSAVEVTGA